MPDEKSKIIKPQKNLAEPMSRREFVGHCCRGLGFLAVGGLAGAMTRNGQKSGTVWQIDPNKCSQCGKCATVCVLSPSAVKCVHEYALCGYCKICFGYFADVRPNDNEGAESQRCPTGAIGRGFVEDPYYQYVIDEQKCIGCALCVKGCKTFGNSSLILQVRHDRCLNCNQCAIATVCPAQAFTQVPVDKPYLLRTKG
ncbi:MAG: 4Fe-4S binding protein [Armatimonadota bacterium]